MTYDVTPDKILSVNASSTRATIVSLVLALFILSSSLWIYSHHSARPKIDRISFKLLLWSMAFEVIYDVVYIVLDASPSFVLRIAKTKGCVVGVYFMLGSMGVVNYLCTCIAINLMMTICFQSNPIALGLEKWYVGVSIVLGMGVPIVPAVLGHFGEDKSLGVCYFTATDKDERFKLLLIDLYIWQGLSCIVATGAIVATLIKLFRHGRATTQALLGGNTLNCALQETLDVAQFVNQSHPDTESGLETIPTSSALESISKSQYPVESSGRKSFTLCRKALFAKRDVKVESPRRLQDRLFRIALRISMYPVALIIVNGLLTAGDMYLAHTGGIQSRTSFVLFVVYDFLYGGRGIVFASLGIFVDPCLFRGFKAAFEARKRTAVNEVEQKERNRNLMNWQPSHVSPNEIELAISPTLKYHFHSSQTSLYQSGNDLSSLKNHKRFSYPECTRSSTATFEGSDLRRTSSLDKFHIHTPRNGSSSSTSVLMPHLRRQSIPEVLRSRSGSLYDCAAPKAEEREPFPMLVRQTTFGPTVGFGSGDITTSNSYLSGPQITNQSPEQNLASPVLIPRDEWQRSSPQRPGVRRASEGGIVLTSPQRPKMHKRSSSRYEIQRETQKLFDEVQVML
nr:uncharacterized protein CI109_004251 [Kwoniella shandongensis]KAA5527435.1 hypothetical protein CI109_004251 [Kwoniella shandongensis]